jgi:hypothetical protein
MILMPARMSIAQRAPQIGDRSTMQALTDVDRLLRHAARRAVEGLEAALAPVHPGALAERVIYAHQHLAAVRARHTQLIAEIADYVRELRAMPEERS